MSAKLSKIERIILINQFKILNKLEPESFYEQHIEALEGGFTNFYDEIYQDLNDEVPNDTLDFTNNVLEMYRAMTVFANKSDDQELKSLVVFNGFDQTGEFDYWNYTDFLICKLGRYPELRANKGNDDFSSHSSIISKYKRQFKVWEKHGKPIFENITKEIALEIIES
ncbi:YfbU family protein [Acinetobacter modestus]|uniref:YfbU family protein n=1 Tax=Acinetobacter modestus TaxID=1776740 RepID=UPI0030175DC8